MFRVYHSNQLELLTELIIALIEREPLDNPLAKEQILVQSQGMAQWLQIQLAQHFGIAANIDFPLPAHFIWQIVSLVLPTLAKQNPFSKEMMAWKLMRLLPKMCSETEFSVLNRYLSGENYQRKLHQLASRIADLFDQYLVYRPLWLNQWDQGQLIDGLDVAQQWQASLWRALTADSAILNQPSYHRADLYQRVIQALDANQVTPDNLPKRIFICGISALPPLYLQLLNALAKHIDIHLMLTNPCREYWYDIKDNVFLTRLRHRYQHNLDQNQRDSLSKQSKQVPNGFNKQSEQHNPLLASWGKLARDNMYLLAELADVQEVDAFVDIGRHQLLTRIQQDILELKDPTQFDNSKDATLTGENKLVLAADDHSLSLHACHSPQRELEVLHDHLLALLDDNADLAPRDIIVMLPDIDSYTPYIQAVFANTPKERQLPFAISDRRSSEIHPILHTFITLLNLPQSRFTAEQVLALLDTSSLAQRFAIDESGQKKLRQWAEETQIHWGLDDESLRALGLPATGQNSWRFGLTRMLLGYAMESQSGDWQGVLPYDNCSGLAAELVGQLGILLDKLAEWHQRLTPEHHLKTWLPFGRQMLDDFFVRNSETEAVLNLIEQQWQQLIRCAIDANYADKVPLVVLRDKLIVQLDNEQISPRFLAGSINFCTFMPMRSIPFKIVCLLGMNDGVYPRSINPLSFDLMAKKPKRGDRCRREDDRYLFLEALLSAKNQLYISYIGRSIQNNQLRYPSVLVTELVDYIAQSHRLTGHEKISIEASAQAIRKHLWHWHPPTPFSRDNFIANQNPVSYAKEWLPAARRAGKQTGEFNQQLTPLTLTTIEFEQLQQFYRHPTRGFFQQRLQVYFSPQTTEISDEEVFTLNNLQRYRLNHRLLTALINGHSSEQFFAKIKASGELPYGEFGTICCQQQDEIQALAKWVIDKKKACHYQEISLNIANIELRGWLNQVQSDGLLRWRPKVLSIIDGLSLWLEHLVYCCLGGLHDSRMFGRKVNNNWSEWRFQALPPGEAKQELTTLVNSYQRGMNQPLMLFPKSGWAWLQRCYQAQTAQICWDDDSQHKAKQAFIQIWQGNSQVPGEGQDPYIARLLRRLDDSHFQQILDTTASLLLPLAKYNLG